MKKIYQLANNTTLEVETNPCMYAGTFNEVMTLSDAMTKALEIRQTYVKTNLDTLPKAVNEYAHYYDILDQEVAAALYYHSIVERSEINSAILV